MSLLKKALFLIFYTPSLPLFSYFCKRLPYLFLFYFFLNYLSINSFLCKLYIFIEISNNFLLVYDFATFFRKKREWDRNRWFVRIRFRRPTSAQLSRAVKADEISVVEPTQPLRLARQSKNIWEARISVPLSAFCVSMLLIVRVLQSLLGC